MTHHPVFTKLRSFSAEGRCEKWDVQFKANVSVEEPMDMFYFTGKNPEP